MIFDPPYNLIILDDDKTIHELLNTYLKAPEYEKILNVHNCENYEQARNLLEEKFIHFLLLDINLDGVNGLDLIHDLKNMESGLKIITFTADNSLSACFDCFRRGADYHIKKPINKEHLNEVIHLCIDMLNYWRDTFLDDK